MSLNTYWAYGLSIRAEIACPELPRHPNPNALPDVTIRVEAAQSAAPKELENGHYEVHKDLFLLHIKEVAQYRVESGKRIVITPYPDADPDKVRLFLLGSTMGALLYQRGLFPLHGSAVETPWGAMIFVGTQGAGKSTLAAQFHQAGYRLLSDDVCAVTTTADGLYILPALAQFRLCADAFERLGTPSGARFDVDKFVVPMGEGYCPNPVPLRAIHVLGNHEDEQPKYEEIKGLDSIKLLLENLYRPHYLRGQATQHDLMRMAASIAQGAKLATVTRRRDTAAIAGLVSFLEADWEKRFVRLAVEEKN